MEGLNFGLRDALEHSAYILKEVWDSEDLKEGAQSVRRAPRPELEGEITVHEDDRRALAPRSEGLRGRGLSTGPCPWPVKVVKKDDGTALVKIDNGFKQPLPPFLTTLQRSWPIWTPPAWTWRAPR